MTAGRKMNRSVTKGPGVCLILASSSPRRSRILNDLHVRFISAKSGIEEIPQRGEKPEAVVVRIAREKALKAASRCRKGLILACDTVVVIDGIILGKPESMSDAMRMLRMLSGRWHRVLSSVCLYDVKREKLVSGYSATKVKFRQMSEAEIRWYVNTGEPLDKAGSYGIQKAGMLFIEKIVGSYTGVVGLPVELLGRLLRRMGVDILSLIGGPF